MTYHIVEEIYRQDEATIRTEIEVYDYQNSRQKAKEYMETHQDEFWLDSGDFDHIRYENLQLKEMNQETKRVKYTIDFHVKLEDNTWTLQDPDYQIIEKIHGLF